jgi:hypothetical protein
VILELSELDHVDRFKAVGTSSLHEDCSGQEFLPSGVEGALLYASQRAKLKIPGKVWNSEKLPTARGLTCFGLVALAACLSLLGGVATAQGPAEPKPLWQINARKLGVPRTSESLHGSFGFQNNNTLRISWITPDGPLPRIPKKASPIPAVLAPSHLHVLFLDAKAGTSLSEQEVSVPSDLTELFILHSGNLLGRAGNSLKLYSPKFVLLNEAELPAPVKTGDFISQSNIEISPDGRRISVCSEQGVSGKKAITIFDADDLKSLGSLPDGQESCPEQFGDDSFLFNTSNSGDALQSTIQSWENESRNPTLRVAGDPGLVRLLNGEAFIVANGSRMEVRTIDGKVLMTDTLPKKQGFTPWNAAEARDSAIFAVETTRVTLQVAAALPEFAVPIPTHLPSDYQIAVYDLKEKRRIFAIKTGAIYQYALSPDGSFFATLSWTHMNLDVLLPIPSSEPVAVYKLR